MTTTYPENITTWTDNQTLEDCLKENFGKTIVDCNRCFNLDERPQWQLYIHAIMIGIIIVISMVGNALILVLILKYKKLRQRTVMISLSVIFANTVLVLTYHLPVLISTLCADWVFMFVGCQVFGFLSTDFILTRWFTMAVLALDRFCVVRFPFSYPKHDKYILTTLISISWVLPMLFSAVTVDGYSSVSFRHNVPTCLLYAPDIGKGKLFFSCLNTVSFLMGGILPTVLYLWLFYKGRKLRRSMMNVGKLTINHSRESIISAHDIQLNNSTERRAIVTFALIFVTFCLTGLPAYIFQMLRYLSLSLWCGIPHIIHFVVIEIFLSSTALDPFLVMRDRDFRKRLKHLLCCHNNCGKYYTNRSNIYPELPQERDFDAVRSMAVRALNLVSLPASRGSTSHSDPTIRPRSGSAPASYLSSRRIPRLRPSATTTTLDPIQEVEKEVEDCGNQVLEDTHSSSYTASGSCGWEDVVDKDFKSELVYTGINRECMKVTITFED